MKKIFNNSLLAWILVAMLLATNLTTIITISTRKSSVSEQFKNSNSQDEKIPDQYRTRYFREKLGLERNQQDHFRDINRSYHHNARELTHQMRDLRFQMMNELEKEVSDSIILTNIATQIGNLHKKLKMNTIHYYLDMKQKCTPEQKEQLKMLFNSMLQNDVDFTRSRRGQRHKQNQNF